jgi:hypothetical protein
VSAIERVKKTLEARRPYLATYEIASEYVDEFLSSSDTRTRLDDVAVTLAFDDVAELVRLVDACDCGKVRP